MTVGYAPKVGGRRKIRETLQGGERSLIAIAADTLSSNGSEEILARFPKTVNRNQSFTST